MVFYRLRAVQRWNPIAISLLRKRLTHYNSFDVVGQSVLPSEASVRAINPAEPTSRDRVSDDASAWDPRPGLGHQLLLAIWWCVGFYALTGCSSREFVERSYVNVDDVTRQNAFSPAGKVPVRLPPSSIDIRIRSSVQTDDVWAVFSWDDTTRGRLNECVLSPISTVTFPRNVPDWWPDDLHPEKPITQRLELSYDFLTCPDMGVFAIPHGQRRGYYWYRAANTQAIIRGVRVRGSRSSGAIRSGAADGWGERGSKASKWLFQL